MANARIDLIGLDEVTLLTSLYNSVFRPAKTEEFFLRRYKGREGVIIMIAHLDDRPVGFATGFELKPSTFFAWLCGVLPDARRMGVAAQLLDALHSVAAQEGYHTVRFECYSRHRPMLHLAIKDGYDIVGLRWDRDGHDNLVIFEKYLNEQAEETE